MPGQSDSRRGPMRSRPTRSCHWRLYVSAEGQQMEADNNRITYRPRDDALAFNDLVCVRTQAR